MDAESGEGSAFSAKVVGVLVVVGVLAICLLLLFSAIQAAREAARRAACLNNLKSVGLGFQNMDSAIKRFPPSCLVPKDENGIITSMDGWSWCVHILPYVESRALWDPIDIRNTLPLDGRVAQREALGAFIDLFHCPSFSGSPFVDPTTKAEAITN